MITGADEYPFHQTPDPIAFAGTDRNFYDRFFFNGYNHDGSVFFAVAFGVYPQLGIMDGAVSILKDGRQRNLRVSRRMQGNRANLCVGPLKITIGEPLVSSTLTLDDNEAGVAFHLEFTARHAPIEEPRFTRRIGTRAFMDYSRMTQNVAWSGKITCDGETIAISPDAFVGTRDRSWGVRPVGAPDTQPPSQGALPQFFWFWSPCNFDDAVAFSHTNDDGYGRPWNRRAGLTVLGEDPVEFDDVEYDYEWAQGSRRIARLTTSMRTEGREARLVFTPRQNFYMSGLGYTHPEWGHGRDHGDYRFAHDDMNTAECSEHDPLYLHIQALSDVELHYRDTVRKGVGVMEQLFIGPHEPSGFGEGLSIVE